MSFAFVILLINMSVSCVRLPVQELLKPGEKVGDMVLTTSRGVDWVPFFIDLCVPDPLVPSKDCGELPMVPSLFIGFGLSENDLPTLDSEWLKTSGWELFFDNQPINLSAFGTIDFEEGGQIIRGWNVVIDIIDPGKHSIRYVVDYMDHYDMVFTFSVASPEPVLTPRRNIAHGTLSENTSISSNILGYKVSYRVYTPAGYETMGKLPAIYVADGENYADPTLGAMIIVLDNLIADQKIEPLIAVFIDARDPESGMNRRESQFVPLGSNECPYCDFVASELVAMIDATYKTTATPDSRDVLGFSLGGYFTSEMGLAYSDIFHLVAIQSPSYRGSQWIYSSYENAERLPVKVFMSHGTKEYGEGGPRLRDILQEKGYPLLYIEIDGGHIYATVRVALDDMLMYFFGKG
jgi:enterochelin esterase-like enzyme